MATTTDPPTASGGSDRLTFRFTPNPDGWVTAQIVEYPEAISQGPTESEARANVLEALHDLIHEPTTAERIAFATDAALDELVDHLEAVAQRLLDLLEFRSGHERHGRLGRPIRVRGRRA